VPYPPAAVRAEMARQRRVPAPTVRLALTVTNFRIRSTATSVWFGAMAGADILDVEATAVKDDQVLNRWKTGSGSIVGGLIRPGMDGRFERLISYGSTYRGRVVMISTDPAGALGRGSARERARSPGRSRPEEPA
jgi:hypothetical protein